MPVHCYRQSALIVILALAFSARARIIFVDTNAIGLNHGQSWQNAYVDLQTGLANAVSGDEIWVANGTYYPTSGSNRSVSFVIPAGVQVYGGFRGGFDGEFQRSLRRWKDNTAILSGNIGDANSATDNSYHVVEMGEDAFLDGFTIRDGYADGSNALNNGGGVFIDGVVDNAYLRNCIIRNNHAAFAGGGIYTESRNPRFATCLFIQNSAHNGAAIYVHSSTGTRLANCTITDNHASSTAGAIFSFVSPVRVSSCILWDNTPIEIAGIDTIVRYSIVKGGWDKLGSVNAYDADPLFADSASEDYHLTDLSPAIDAGVAADIPQDFPNPFFGAPLPYDYDHNERRRDMSEAVDKGPLPQPAVDCGIYEFPGFDGIGNRVWQDANNNGIQDPGEPGVEGIQVNHIDVERNPNPIATTFTDANGFYSFPGVRAGPHIIEFAIGPLRQFTLQNVGDDRFDSDADPITGRAGITLAESQATFGIDAGVMSTHFFVNPAATNGGNSGVSWANAFITLEAALNRAVDGDEIWVKAGTYIPNGADRDATFAPRPGVSLYGGFNGTENERHQRDWRANPTILSGARGLATNSDNCYHVLTLPTSDTTIDGFIIRDGNADGATTRGQGGGIYLPAGAILFMANCELRNNRAVFGGGVYAFGATLDVHHSIAHSNTCSFGGAFYLGFSEASFVHCVFHGNAGVSGGGGIYADSDTAPVVTNCIIYSNSPNAIAADSATVAYSIVEGGWPDGTAVIDADPRFADSASHDYHLTLASPAIDAGNNNARPEDSLDFDLKPRRWDVHGIVDSGNGVTPVADIGAFEFPGSGVIGGVMWNDRDVDGEREAGETRRVGNSVKLRDTARRLISSTITDAEGRYEFADLAPGNYVIEFVLPPGREFTHEKLPDDRTLDSDANPATAEALVALEPSSSRLHIDAGARPGTFRVNPAAIGGANNGSSWADAYTSLQVALDQSIEDDEIWLAAGTYNPSSITTGFDVPEAVRVYGGFVGGEISRDARRWWANLCILAGDGAHHVIQAANDCVLDGLTIRDGNNDDDFGGGVLLTDAANVRIDNCIVRNNIGETGGGVALRNASVGMRHTLIVRNIGSDGAGLYLDANSAATLEHCVIANNLGSGFGAGIRALGNAAPSLANSIVWGNSPDAFSAPNTSAEYCIIQSGWPGNGNLSVDPLFSNAAALDYTLSASSPAIDAGSNFATAAGAILDLGGGPRFVNYQGAADTGLGSAPIIDIGAYELPGAWLGDFVWHDADNDGVQDEGEPGAIGISINLLNGNGTITLDTGISDADGHYRFTGLEPGQYVLEFLVPAARGFTLRDQGGNDELDSDPNRFTGRMPVTLAHNEVRLNIDAGLATETLRVKPGANGLANGKNWNDAYPNLADALNASFDGDEVWVAAGTYVPSLSGDRSASFVARPGVSLLGGFAGFELSADQRNHLANPTILSGDIGVANSSSDNSYHVVTLHTNAFLHGFTIRDGRADGPAPDNNGGGILVQPSVKAPTILDCEVRNNYAKLRGGGIYSDSGPLIIRNTDFASNQAISGGGGLLVTNATLTLDNADFAANSSASGAGMSIDLVTADISNCTFSSNIASGFGGAILARASQSTLRLVNMTGNSAPHGGAAIFQQLGNMGIEDLVASANSGPTLLFWDCGIQVRRAIIDGNTGVGVLLRKAHGSLVHCRITDNRGATGAGIQCDTSSPHIVNCHIRANISSFRGGGLYVSLASAPIIWNSEIIDNIAVEGAGLYLLEDAAPELINCTIANNIASSVGGGIFATTLPTPSLKNCIVAKNHPSAVIAAGGSLYRCLITGQSTAAHSDVWIADPQFVAQGNYRLQPSSPAIDRGDNSIVPADIFDIDDDGNTLERLPIDVGLLPRFLNRTEVPDEGLGVPPYIDLGAHELGDPGQMGDFVWHDVNGNGSQDFGEGGIEGVTVRLLDANEAVLETLQTDRNGYYRFDVPVGSFRLEFEPPPIFLFTERGLGGNSNLDSDVAPSTGRSDLIAMGSGEIRWDLDVGLINGPGLFTFTVALRRGWNLIAFPYEIINPTRTTSRLGELGLSAPYGWANGQFYRATAMSAKVGYFIHNARGPQVLTLFGPAANLPRTSLSIGWNLIGIAGNTTAPASSTNIFDPAAPVLGAPAFGFEAGSYRTTPILEPGKGYWVNRAE